MTKLRIKRVYYSHKTNIKSKVIFDKKNPKRPSWIKVMLNTNIAFIKILFKGEAFWYRRFLGNYFFPLVAASQDYKIYYDRIAKDYELFAPQNEKLGNLLVRLFNKLGVSKSAKILDIGAGTGIIAELLVKNGYKNITLLDISKKQLNIAKLKKDLRHCHFIEMDITRYKLTTKFDVIIETMALDYYSNNILNIFHKIRNSLNDNGIFILIERHNYPELNMHFKEIKKGKKEIETSNGLFGYYYYIGSRIQ